MISVVKIQICIKHGSHVERTTLLIKKSALVDRNFSNLNENVVPKISQWVRIISLTITLV